MPAALQVKLSESEDITLEQLSLANSIAKRTKQRAYALRLNNKGWSVDKISNYLKCSPQTVRKTIHRWETKGLMGLWDLPRSGRKPSWKEEDWQCIEKWLESECSYTSKQLAEKLQRERQIKLGAEQIRRILKKKIGVGKE
ncbi:helix-turn-helix domain-containing protein [Moorena producens JHB]|jgi:transposase|uniref:Helix-turn-helix domain-containing protein n=1 Tax=Moorena producens (strain JHB) TaxID=1454205 RepID=A0A1D9FZ94_MOOP1|nr:helix-turn-helix domain-containing protein [Moorena producens]AOY80605.1 helix-turn-helix domain-containing protein [Moorena producens JHB]